MRAVGEVSKSANHHSINMAGIIGTLDKFEIGGTEPFEVYTERFELFCSANGITDEGKKKSVFLTSLGVDTYKLVRNLCTPNPPASETLPKIVELLKAHLSPEPNVIVERFKFNSRSRKDGESVADYVAQLRNLARDCKYGDKLEENLRDRIVCGIGDVQMQKKMLAEKGLTFEKAQTIALSSEAAAKQTREISGTTDAAQTVHLMEANRGNSKWGAACYRCGDTRHMASKCLFRDKQCFVCDKVGHIAKVCNMRKNSTASSSQQNSQKKYDRRTGHPDEGSEKMHAQKNVDHESVTNSVLLGEDGLYNIFRCEVQEEGVREGYFIGQDSKEPDHPIHRCEIQREKPLYTSMCVNGRVTKFEIDTGASLTDW